MRALVYARRSTDKQDMSIEEQLDAARKYAHERGGTIVGQPFTDDAISGSVLEREGLRALLEACRDGNGEITHVLTWDAARLARPIDRINGLLVAREIVGTGKKLIYVSTGQEVDTSFGSDILGIAQFEVGGEICRQTSLNTFRGLKDRVERGFDPGRPAPYGWDRQIVTQAGEQVLRIRDMPDGTKELHDPQGNVVRSSGHRKRKEERSVLVHGAPDRISVVREMFSRFADGESMLQIRDDLNIRGAAAPRGGKWSTASIKSILMNPIYAGRSLYNRRTQSKWFKHAGRGPERRPSTKETASSRKGKPESIPEEAWVVSSTSLEPMVDLGAWDKVHARFEANKGRFKHVGRSAKSDFLLTGAAYCGSCDGRLSGRTTTSSKGYKTRYYICSVHNNKGSEACSAYFQVPKQSLEDMTLACVGDCLKGILAKTGTRELANDIRRELEALLSPSREGEALRKRRQELARKAKNLREHMAQVSPEVARATGLYEEAEKLTAEIGQIEKAQNSGWHAEDCIAKDIGKLVGTALSKLNNIPQVLATGTVDEKRELIKLFMQKVVVDPEKKKAVGYFDPTAILLMVAGAGFEPATSGL